MNRLSGTDTLPETWRVSDQYKEEWSTDEPLLEALHNRQLRLYTTGPPAYRSTLDDIDTPEGDHQEPAFVSNMLKLTGLAYQIADQLQERYCNNFPVTDVLIQYSEQPAMESINTMTNSCAEMCAKTRNIAESLKNVIKDLIELKQQNMDMTTNLYF